MGNRFESGNCQQILHGLRRLSKTVNQFFEHFLRFLIRFNSGDPLIHIQFLRLICNICGRNKCIRPDINGSLKLFGRCFSPGFFHRFVKHLAVQIISNRLHVTALFGSQQISGSPDLQVPHGNLKSAAQIRILPDGSQSFFRHLFEHFVSAVHKKRIRRTIGSADPPAQLIQLGKPHIIRVMNNHGIDI